MKLWRLVRAAEQAARREVRPDGGAEGDRLVGIYPAAGLLVEAGFERLQDHGHARHAAHGHHRVDMGPQQPELAHQAVDDVHRLAGQIHRRQLEIDAPHLDRAVHPRDAEGNAHALARGQLPFHLLGLDGQRGRFARRQLDPVGIRPASFAQQVDHQVGESVVEVLAAQVMVAVAAQHADLVGAHARHRHVERATAEIVHEQGLARRLLGQAVRVRRRRGFGDEPLQRDARRAARLQHRLALSGTVVRRHRHHRAGDALAQARLGVVHQLAQQQGRQPGGIVGRPVELDPEVRIAHMALEERRGVDASDALEILRVVPHDHIAAIGADDRRGDAVAVAVRHDERTPVLPDRRHRAVGGPQIDADLDLFHGKLLST